MKCPNKVPYKLLLGHSYLDVAMRLLALICELIAHKK